MVSKHYKTRRYEREKFINECLGGNGNVIDSFIVDRKHPMGAEIHSVTDNGVIIITNLISGKVITHLIARPQQIKRYYEFTGRKPPSNYEDILCLAQKHKNLGYNKI